MFSSLSNKLSDIFTRLKKRGVLTEADIDAVMREVRIALLEADVALPVVKDFIASLKAKALGAEVVQKRQPGADGDQADQRSSGGIAGQRIPAD